eukprot:1170824-Prymnesium_polylepis.1
MSRRDAVAHSGDAAHRSDASAALSSRAVARPRAAVAPPPPTGSREAMQPYTRQRDLPVA